MNEATTYGIFSVLAAIIAFAVTAILGKYMVPWLHKLRFGQTIKEIGPKWHQAKQGTPTMGGIMFVIGIFAACIICLPLFEAAAPSYTDVARLSRLQRGYIWGGVGLGVFSGFIGFIDDYISVVKHRNTGLSAKQKYLMQLAVAAAYLATIWLCGDKGQGITRIPFLGEVRLGIWFYIISVVMITGFINAVNLTDGIDGLCSSVTFFAAVTLMLIAGLMRFFDIGIMTAALAGGCIGFLVWNFYPAKVFMGDTGSLFLGGMFCAAAYGLQLPILIPLIGIIYLCEAGSVIIQRYYFKLTHGRRIFKMSPIHHHYELSGWSEVKIDAVFSAVTVVCGIIAVMLAVKGDIL